MPMIAMQKKEEAFRKLLQQQTKCLIQRRIYYDNQLSRLFIIAYPDLFVNLSDKNTKNYANSEERIYNL